jgi:uncharacterized protein DUF2795
MILLSGNYSRQHRVTTTKLFKILKRHISYPAGYMSSDRRENPEQIPSSHNEGHTKAMVSEQARIEGERKEVDVKDYPKAAAIAQVLKDLKFPADKKQIIDCVERARPQSEEILSDIQKIEDKQYENVSEVTRAAGLVRR